MLLPLKNTAQRTVIPLSCGKKREARINQFFFTQTVSPSAAKTLLYSAVLTTAEVLKSKPSCYLIV